MDFPCSDLDTYGASTSISIFEEVSFSDIVDDKVDFIVFFNR